MVDKMDIGGSMNRYFELDHDLEAITEQYHIQADPIKEEMDKIARELQKMGINMASLSSKLKGW